jgi:N-acetylmuramoyl-L-alanine amidase
MRRIDWIVVHTAAAANAQGQPVYQCAKTIHEYHVGHNGWKKGGYHAVIQQDGLIARDPAFTRTDEEVGAHAQGLNAHTLGVCVTGHGDFADFTDLQKLSLYELLLSWCQKYGLEADHIVGHRETESIGGPPVHKTCPGLKVNMVDIRAKVEGMLRGV